MKLLLKLTVAAAMLASNAGAVPIHYIYTGDFFTGNSFQSDGVPVVVDPQPPGFTLADRFTGTVTLDDNGQIFGQFSVGPYLLGGLGVFEIDSLGAVIRWGLSDALPGLDIAVGGLADGSGRDVIFGDNWSGGKIHAGAFVDYPAGSPSRWSFGPSSVPDTGTTLLLLSLAVVPMLLWRRRPRRGTA